MKIAALVMWILACLSRACASGTGLNLDQSLEEFALNVSCDKIYRFIFPLRGREHSLVVVLAFPSHQSLRKQGVQDTPQRAVELSKLYYAEKGPDGPFETGGITVDANLFEKLLEIIGTSEAFALPTQKPVRYDDYLTVSVHGEGLITAERYSEGIKKSVQRVYGESAATNYLANELAVLIGKKVKKAWSAGYAEPEKIENP